MSHTQLQQLQFKVEQLVWEEQEVLPEHQATYREVQERVEVRVVMVAQVVLHI